MKNILVVLILSFIVTASLYSQSNYYFSRHLSLPEQTATAKTIDLGYPIQLEDVRSIGMGNTQVAGKNLANAMMANPAFLAQPNRSFEVFGFMANLPPETYNAAFFLADNMTEFEEALSLNQVWDGVNAFFVEGASLEDRFEALNTIQKGMRFTLDLFDEVIGDAENPQKHAIALLPSFQAQWDQWGVSLYGYGHSVFMVQQSPTLDRLMEIEIPENMDNPLQAAKAAAQIFGTLAHVFLFESESFANEVFPMAFYLAYVDMVLSVGRGFQINENLHLGMNLKFVNRRFSTDRVPVSDYEAILSNAWSSLNTDVTGLTADIGALYTLPFGTRIGASLQNILPMKSLDNQIVTPFRFPQIVRDRDEDGNIITNAQGDTALVSTYRRINTIRPFSLNTPFIANIGINHPITSNWDIALDWVDIAENDTRYRETTERIGLGTEYRFGVWQDKLSIALRTGMADEHWTAGLGVHILNRVRLDGAMAYDRMVKAHSYFAQIKVGW
ncbi:conjugal transfer protein TraF [candidate division KSB1 bacterium]|nr:conjugal transfer protein TraF [candidate division KSB1 bacterium]